MPLEVPADPIYPGGDSALGRLSQVLSEATTVEALLRGAVEWLGSTLGVPVVAWCLCGDGQGFPLAWKDARPSLEAPPPPWVQAAEREGRPQESPDPPAWAWPVEVLGEVSVVLEVRGYGADTQEHLALEGLRLLSKQIGLLQEAEERRLLLRLLDSLQGVENLQAFGERALGVLLEAFGLDAGSFWEARGDRLELLTPMGAKNPEAQDALARLQGGIPYGIGLAWRVYETGTPLFTSAYHQEDGALPVLKAMGWQAVAILPLSLGRAPRARRLLVLGSRGERWWTRAERWRLVQAARLLAIYLEPLTQKARQEAISQLLMDSLGKAHPELYQRLLEEAIRQVPGAQAGSLLVLEGEEYRFQAAKGYDLEALQTVRFSREPMRLWYGLGEEALAEGRPRVLSGEERFIAEVSHRTAPAGVMDTAGRVWEIRANLCLPIPHEGEVLAFLNLDNLQDPRAFGEDSLEVARLFAPPLAALLHQSRVHRLLEEAAQTDPLTGLFNRRAFDRMLQEELARASRHGYPFSLGVLDLKGFKRFNDLLGHAAGDRALKQVAEALCRERRQGDRIFRWGGDEFAALLPYTNKDQAIGVALRYARAIGHICMDGLCLGVSVGLATYPQDGTTPEALLAVADSRMYEAKSRGLEVMA